MADFSIYGELGINTSKFKSDLKNSEKSLKGFGENFSNVTKKVSDGLNNWGINLDKIYDKGSSVFKNWGVDIDKFAGHFGMSGKMMTGLAGVATLAVNVGKKVAAVINDLTEAYKVQAQAEIQLETAAKNNPMMNSTSVENLKEYASAIQKVSTYGDEQLLPFMAQLASAGRSEKEVMDIMTAATDLASSGMMSLDSAVSALNATYNGTAGSLGKQISGLNNLTKEQLKNGEAVKIVGERYKGMAQEVAKTTGTTQQLKNAWGDLTENIGEGFEKALAPVRGMITSILSGINDTISSLKKASKEADTLKKVRAGRTEGLDSGALATVVEKENAYLAQAISERSAIFAKAREFMDMGGTDITQSVLSNISTDLTGSYSRRIMSGDSTAMQRELAQAQLDYLDAKKRMESAKSAYNDAVNAEAETARLLAEQEWQSEVTQASQEAMDKIQKAKDIIAQKKLAGEEYTTFMENDELYQNALSAYESMLQNATDWKRMSETEEAKEILALVQRYGGGRSSSETSRTISSNAQESMAWTEKLLQMQLDAINKEKDEKLKALQYENASQEELDSINLEYAEKQIEINEKLLEMKKNNDLNSLKSYSNYAEEKLKLDEYYANESAKYEISVKENAYKEISDSDWQAKLLQQKLDALEEEKNAEINSYRETQNEKINDESISAKKRMRLADETEKRIYEIRAEYNNKQIELYNSILEIEKKNALEVAKTQKEKNDIEIYYAEDLAQYIDNLTKDTVEKNEVEVEGWSKKLKAIFSKIGQVMKTVFTKTFSFIKSAFTKLWDFMQKDPDQMLDAMLETSDKILTFISNALPNLPAFFDAFINIIEAIIEVLIRDDTINMFVEAFTRLFERVVDLIVNNLGPIIKALGKLVGALIKGVLHILSEVNWIEFIADVLLAIWDAIMSILKGLVDGMVEVFSKMFNWIGDQCKKMFDGIGNLFSKKNKSTGSHVAKGILGVLTGGLSFIGTGFATGTNNASSGLHLVGEQGPELIDFHGGERVYTADSTRDIMSGAVSGGNNFNVTFNNLQDTSAYSMLRQLKQYQRDMALNGII